MQLVLNQNQTIDFV